MTSRQGRYRDIHIEREGQTFKGTYHTQGGMIYVSSAYGSRSTQLSGLVANPEAFAEAMLAQIVWNRAR